MKKVFFMTVGLGKDKSESSLLPSSLPDSLAHSIEHYDPEKMIFFGSEKSQKVVEKIKHGCEKRGISIENSIFVSLSDFEIDDFTSCYNRICTEISRYSGYKIIMDYTSGTKTMVAAQCVAALLHNTTLTLTAGERNHEDGGSVISGTSRVKEQPLYEAYDKIHYENVKRDFNAYRFDSALESMKKIVKCKQKPNLKNFITGYKKWDLMNWSDAIELLRDVDLGKSTPEKTTENIKFLDELVNLYSRIEKNKENDGSSPCEPTTPYIMILADLLNNAQRRIDEGKYDDATARLYRATELIAEIILFNRGINALKDQIFFKDIEKLISNKKVLESYERKILRVGTDKKTPDPNGKIAADSMGMRAKFYLLRQIGDDRGEKFFGGTLDSDMKIRNKSILAHGLQPVGKDIAVQIYNSVLEYSHYLFTKEKIEDLMKNAEFATL